MTNIAIQTTEDISTSRFEEVLAQYAAAYNRETAIKKWMELEMTRIKDTYTQELLHLQRTKTSQEAVIRTFCKERKQVLFARRRRYITAYGTVGFRLGTPRLQPLEGHTWESILQQVKVWLPAYIRPAETIAKDMLIADRATAAVAPLLEQVGLRVVQEEIFFIEVKQPLAEAA